MDKWRNSNWLCRCDCGNIRVVKDVNLKSGNTKSCGCLNIEKIISRGTKNIGENSPRYKHGDNCGWSTKSQREFAEKIRKRDNYICQDCGKTQEQEFANTGKRLACHHKDGDHFNNIDENAITLCGTCHNPHNRKQRQKKEAQAWLDAAYRAQYPK